MPRTRLARPRTRRWLALLAATALGACQCQPAPPAHGPDEVYIPGGTFVMGHAAFSGYPACSGKWNQVCSDFAPAHPVTLSPYLIDTYEVTFGDYKKCADAGFCDTSWKAWWELDAMTTEMQASLADPAYAAYPVVGLNADAAERYCEWRGKRLPTEAEWERAARGPDDTDYPWGNEPPTCDRVPAAINCDTSYVGGLVPVGTTPGDVSVEGVHDLYGNAYEIVADWYLSDYYLHSPGKNPIGPSLSELPTGLVFGPQHAVRGVCGGGPWDQAWDWANLGCPMWARSYQFGNEGFRCARDAFHGSP